MTYLSTTDILENVLSKIQDNSESSSTRILSYINSVCQALSNERDWKFLEVTLSVVLDDGVIALPTDYARMVEIVGDGFVLNRNDLLSNKDVMRPHNGYRVAEVDGGLQIIPAPTGSVDLIYIPLVPIYTGADISLFPGQTRPYIERAVLTDFYEYDNDPRWATSVQLTDKALAALKRWDNSIKPARQNDPTGKIR